MKSRIKPLLIATLISIAHTGHSDSLKDIYELAVKNDAQLKAAEATYKANQETENIALSALLPQLNGSAAYNETNTDTDTPDSATTIPGFGSFNSGGASELRTQKDTYSVSLSQPLFDLSKWFSFKSGKEISKQAEAQFAADQENLIVRTVEAYLRVLEGIDNLEASKAEERASLRQLEQTQQRFEVGLIAITDVYEARAQYDNAMVRRLTDEGNLGSYYEALTILTGQPHKELLVLSKDLPIQMPVPNDRNAWTESALKNNNSLRAAIYAQEAASYTAKSRRSEHLPTIEATANYSNDDTDGRRIGSSSAFSTTPEAETETNAWGVKLNVPLYSGGRTSAQSRQSYQQFIASTESRINLERTVVQNARSRFIQLSTDVPNVEARIQSIISARSALDATQAGYEVGTRTIIDVLTTQRNLYNAVREYAAARYNYIQNLMALKQLAGTLTPDDVYKLNNWLVAPGSAMAIDYEGKNFSGPNNALTPVRKSP
jgi:outer membrane protein